MKKFAGLLLAVAMCMSLSVPALAVDMPEPKCQGVLYILTENLKIFAPASQIKEYTKAETEKQKEQLLHEMESDPQNKVCEIGDEEIRIVSADDADVSEVFATPSLQRTTGTWVLPEYEIGMGKIMKVSRSGGIAFTLEEKNILDVYLHFEGTREFGVLCAETTPTFYQSDGTYSNDYPVSFVGLAETGYDRCFVYVKNYSSNSMVVLDDSYVKIY